VPEEGDGSDAIRALQTSSCPYLTTGSGSFKRAMALRNSTEGKWLGSPAKDWRLGRSNQEAWGFGALAVAGELPRQRAKRSEQSPLLLLAHQPFLSFVEKSFGPKRFWPGRQPFRFELKDGADFRCGLSKPVAGAPKPKVGSKTHGQATRADRAQLEREALTLQKAASCRSPERDWNQPDGGGDAAGTA